MIANTKRVTSEITTTAAYYLKTVLVSIFVMFTDYTWLYLDYAVGIL